MITKSLFLTIGWLSFALGLIGIFLPLLPTTPFMIFSAWCFARSSKRLHRWLLSQPGIGELIQDWEHHRIIRTPAKIIATCVIFLCISLSFSFVLYSTLLRIGVILIVFSVLFFIWTRPSIV